MAGPDSQALIGQAGGIAPLHNPRPNVSGFEPILCLVLARYDDYGSLEARLKKRFNLNYRLRHERTLPI